VARAAYLLSVRHRNLDMVVTDPGLRDRLMQLYLRLDPFPEVPAMLREFRSAGFARAIPSNGKALQDDSDLLCCVACGQAAQTGD
jgi:hypothetical protein